MGSVSASYEDYPDTTNVVYYTIAVKCRLGEDTTNGNGNDLFYLNRAYSHTDEYRGNTTSTWEATEIHHSSTPIITDASNFNFGTS